MEAGADVVFDYEGALIASKRLWAFADHLGTLMTNRESEQESAKVDFIGPFAEQFVTRLDTERTDITNVVTQLRTAAKRWSGRVDGSDVRRGSSSGRGR